MIITEQNNDMNLSTVLCFSGSAIQQQAFGMHAIQTIMGLKRNLIDYHADTQLAYSARHQHSRLPLDKLHNKFTKDSY